MDKYLQRLRAKSETQRKTYAFGFTVMAFAIVVGVWALAAHFAPNPGQKQYVAKSESEPGPMSALGANIAAAYLDVKNKISEANPFSESSGTVDDFIPESAGTTTASSSISTTTSTDFGQIIIVDPSQ